MFYVMKHKNVINNYEGFNYCLLMERFKIFKITLGIYVLQIYNHELDDVSSAR